MLKLDYNPIKKQWDERMDRLSAGKRELIEQGPCMGENLKVIKRTRREKKDGAIFLCTVNGTVYYYGKILQAKIEHKTDNWINGSILVCIFREKTTEKNLKNFRGNYSDLLVPPSIVTSQYWSSGWFETIGNVPLTKQDKNLDYGFWDKDLIGPCGGFYKADGMPMEHIPKYFKSYGVTTLSGIYRSIRIETIIDPSLLEM